MKYLVMDNLTQDILGVFASMEEAIESAEYQSAAHPTIVEQDDQPEEQAKNEELVRRIQDWQEAAKFYWAQAFLAKEEKAWERMRACIKQAKDAERYASPESRLLASIFGGTIPEAPELAVKRGATLPDDAIKQARKAVLDEITAYESRRQQPKTNVGDLAKLKARCHEAVKNLAGRVTIPVASAPNSFGKYVSWPGEKAAHFKVVGKDGDGYHVVGRITKLYDESEWTNACPGGLVIGEVVLEHSNP